MKRLLTLIMCCVLLFATASTSVMATSTLEEITGQPPVTSEVNPGNNQGTENNDSSNKNDNQGGSSNFVSGSDFSNQLKDATDVSKENASATKVNQALKKVVSIVAQILSYAITLLLVIRVLLDLLYIAIPFTRSILSNGYMGNPQSGMNQMQGGMQGGMGMGGMGTGMGMGGMGMGGMGMGRYGGGMGMGRYGGGMGGMGMGGMHGGMQGGMQGGAMGQQPGAAMGKIQFVSYAALNAVASAQVVGPDGKPGSPFKIYAKDMVITLILTAALVVLAMSGALTQFGILLGELVATGIASLGGMV